MNKTVFNKLWLAALLLGPVVLLILPADFFNDGPAICPSKLLFNLECLGCGMTRAVMHFIHLDFDSALFFNQGSLIVAPLLIIVWVIWVRNAFKRLSTKP